MTETSKLQQALIDAGMFKIVFSDIKSNLDYSVDITRLPDVTLIELLRYGKRKFNDTLNSTAPEDRGVWADKWLDSAENGMLKSPKGTSRVSQFERECKSVVLGYLLESGHKVAGAKKIIITAEIGFKHHLTEIIAKQKAIPLNQVSPDDVQTLFDRNWQVVKDQAQAQLDVKNQGLVLDIQI